MSTPTTRRLAAAFSMALVAACGTGAEHEQGRETETKSPVGDATTSARSACEVLSESEVAALAGEAVTARPGKRAGRTWSGCGWFGGTSETPYLELTVYWSGGREQWEMQRSGYAMAKDRIRSAERAEIDSIVRPGPVAGLGESAIFAELTPAVVLEGDRMVEMTMFHLPEARKKFRPLAAKVPAASHVGDPKLARLAVAL